MDALKNLHCATLNLDYVSFKKTAMIVPAVEVKESSW